MSSPLHHCFRLVHYCAPSHAEVMRKLRAEQQAELEEEDSTNQSLSAKLAMLQKVRSLAVVRSFVSRYPKLCPRNG